MNDITWRDLAAELTADQVAELTLEEQQLKGYANADLALFDIARDHADANRADAQFAHIHAPAGVKAYHWQQHPAGWRREIETPSQTRHGVTVWVSGWQHADGRVEAGVSVDTNPGADAIGSRQAREVAALVAAAADHADHLTR